MNTSDGMAFSSTRLDARMVISSCDAPCSLSVSLRLSQNGGAYVRRLRSMS